jgi:20S proteasome alpha/beta subunit
MSQIIACQSKNGIVLAADSKGIDFDTSGKMIDLQVDRLVQLTPYTAILAGGGAEGQKMAHTLKRFLSEEGVTDIGEVYSVALPFLATEYERFMRKYCEILPLDPIHHVHFILAGSTRKESHHPYQMYLLWTKKKLPRLDGDEISTAFAVPRNMRLEYRLNLLCKEDRPLVEILPKIQRALEDLSQSQEEIGPPFSYAFITEEGFKKMS